MDDLVKRLRTKFGSDDSLSEAINQRAEAADRIEAQASEIERLRTQDWIGPLLRWDGYNFCLKNLVVGGVYHSNTRPGSWEGYIIHDEIICDTEAEARSAVEQAVREALSPAK